MGTEESYLNWMAYTMSTQEVREAIRECGYVQVYCQITSDVERYVRVSKAVAGNQITNLNDENARIIAFIDSEGDLILGRTPEREDVKCPQLKS